MVAVPSPGGKPVKERFAIDQIHCKSSTQLNPSVVQPVQISYSARLIIARFRQ